MADALLAPREVGGDGCSAATTPGVVVSSTTPPLENMVIALRVLAMADCSFSDAASTTDS